MPLRLTCRSCAGEIEPDDLAIRRGLVTCATCSTIQRLPGVDHADANTAPPDGVYVEREEGYLSVAARRETKSSPAAFNRRESREATVIALSLLGSGSGCLVLLGLVIAPLAVAIPAFVVGHVLVVVPIAWVVALFLLGTRKILPPLRVQGGRVYTSTGFPKSIPADEITQVFGIEAKLDCDEGEVSLLDGIEDLREAFYLVAELRRVIPSVA